LTLDHSLETYFSWFLLSRELKNNAFWRWFSRGEKWNQLTKKFSRKISVGWSTSASNQLMHEFWKFLFLTRAQSAISNFPGTFLEIFQWFWPLIRRYCWKFGWNRVLYGPNKRTWIHLLNRCCRAPSSGFCGDFHFSLTFFSFFSRGKRDCWDGFSVNLTFFSRFIIFASSGHRFLVFWPNFAQWLHEIFSRLFLQKSWLVNRSKLSFEIKIHRLVTSFKIYRKY